MASSERRAASKVLVALAAIAFSSSLLAKENTPMSEVIEVVRFKLIPGVSPSDFWVLDQAVERQHVSKQPGFLRRESASTPDGEWLVIVHWASAADADASMASFASARAAAAFMQGLDASTMTMQRFTRH